MKDRHRSRIVPLTPVRAYRLTAGLSLAEVALESGLTTFRVSVIERDPSQARHGEIDTHHAAVDALVLKHRGAA